jgi:hypothetical protein
MNITKLIFTIIGTAGFGVVIFGFIHRIRLVIMWIAIYFNRKALKLMEHNSEIMNEAPIFNPPEQMILGDLCSLVSGCFLGYAITVAILG